MDQTDTEDTAKPEEVSDHNAELVPEGWTSPPSLQDMKADLAEAGSSHSAQKVEIDRWLDNLNIKGKAKVKSARGNSSVVPKLIRKQAEWRYPALSEPFLSTEDMFKVKPRTWEDTEMAEQNAILINYQMNNKIKKVKFIDRYVRNAVNQGTAIVRISWEREEEEYEDEKPIYELIPNPHMAPMHQQLAAMKIEDPTRYRWEVPEELRNAHEQSIIAGVALEPKVVDHVEVTRTRTIKNNPVLDVLDYRRVIVDPSCEGDMDRANFVIYEFETSLSELKKEGRYENLDNILVKNSSSSALGDSDEVHSKGGTSFNFRDEPRKKFTAYEYWGFWDIDDSGIAQPFVATWVGDTLIRLEENPFPDKKLPFVLVPMLPVEDSVYGEPDGELLEDNQKIIGAVTRGMIDTMAKSANGQTGVKKGTLDAGNRFKFMNGQDYEYNGNVDPRLAFHMHTYPEIPASAQFMIQSQSMEAESMSGVKAFSQGIDGNALGESVGNGKSVLDAASKRETAILRRLADGMEQIGRKMVAMNQEFLDDEEVIRVTNDKFVPIRRDNLGGSYDLKLGISTAEEDNAKAQELAFMNQTIGPNADFAITKMVLVDIARLRKMPELAHKLEKWEPTPDPVAEQMKQLEMQQVMMEVKLAEAKVYAAYREAGLDDAKAQELMAKTRLLNAQADKSDLDFVEQESGVTQERNKELHGEQARSNMALKAMDHEFERETQKIDQLGDYLKKSSEK